MLKHDDAKTGENAPALSSLPRFPMSQQRLYLVRDKPHVIWLKLPACGDEARQPATMGGWPGCGGKQKIVWRDVQGGTNAQKRREVRLARAPDIVAIAALGEPRAAGDLGIGEFQLTSSFDSHFLFLLVYMSWSREAGLPFSFSTP